MTLRKIILLACMAATAQGGTLSMSAVTLATPLSLSHLDLSAEPVDPPGDLLAISLASEIAASEAFREWLNSDDASRIVVEPNYVESPEFSWTEEHYPEFETTTLASATIGLGAVVFALRRRAHSMQSYLRHIRASRS
ncbi:MAG: hypothetical protein ABI972_15205 [Acidobacteriota bacterium]